MVFLASCQREEMISVPECIVLPSHYNRIAFIVIPPKDSQKNTTDTMMVSQSNIQGVVESAFINMGIKKKYDIVDRNDFHSISNEIQFQLNYSSDQISQIGKSLGAKCVFIVNVHTVRTYNYKVGDTYVHKVSIGISAKMIEVETTNIIWHGEHVSEPLDVGIGGIPKHLHHIAEEIAKTLPELEK
jgi:hypothetical protein